VFLLAATSKSGAIPPMAANLLEDSRWIKASKPMWINLVFSSTPVNFAAFAIKSSSKIKVVLMHINMHTSCRTATIFSALLHLTLDK